PRTALLQVPPDLMTGSFPTARPVSLRPKVMAAHVLATLSQLNTDQAKIDRASKEATAEGYDIRKDVIAADHLHTYVQEQMYVEAEKLGLPEVEMLDQPTRKVVWDRSIAEWQAEEDRKAEANPHSEVHQQRREQGLRQRWPISASPRRPTTARPWRLIPPHLNQTP